MITILETVDLQMLHSSSRAVPPIKKGPSPTETEYRQSYKDHDPPAKPRLRKHLEAQRVPLFHMHMVCKTHKHTHTYKF